VERVKMFNQKKKKMSGQQIWGSVASFKEVMQNITPAGNFSDRV
jgi:hypothetical protein